MTPEHQLAEAPALQNQAGSDGNNPIRSIFLHVTKACNLRCSYCYFSAAKPLPDEIQAIDYQRLWRDVVELRPKKLIFTGGEPLLRADIIELLSDFRAVNASHLVRCCLNTNGLLITKALAVELVGLVDEVRVSLDGLRDRNDACRGKGSFDAAVAAIEALVEVGFSPKVLITVTSTGLPDLEELLLRLVGMGVTRININDFRPIGRGARRRELSVERSAIHATLSRIVEQGLLPVPVREAICKSGPQLTCGVGRFVNIMPDGRVFPCHVLTQDEFCCGNIRARSLRDICGHGGPLGGLRRLDFRQLAAQEADLGELTRPGTCMGNVYSKTRGGAAWAKHLPTIYCRNV